MKYRDRPSPYDRLVQALRDTLLSEEEGSDAAEVLANAIYELFSTLPADAFLQYGMFTARFFDTLDDELSMVQEDLS